jgi:hypothetical protein
MKQSTQQLVLRPAADLKAEQESRVKEKKDHDHERAMAKVIVEINKAHNDNQKSITSMAVTASVKAALEAAGYTVKHFPACGMGDMESDEISWE